MKRALICLTALALSGCATAINGTSQGFTVATEPEVGAECILSNGVGKWHVTTPETVVIHKSKNDLEVFCTKNGYASVTQMVPSKVNPKRASNIVFGLAGVLIGDGIDASSGALMVYPESVKVQMVGAP